MISREEAQHSAQIWVLAPQQGRFARRLLQMEQRSDTGRNLSHPTIIDSMPRTDVYLKVELDLDPQEKPERVAAEMARGACRLFRADFALATTGYAEPSPAGGVPVPFAWVALAAMEGGEPEVLRVTRVECPGAARTEAQALDQQVQRLRGG